MSAFLLTYLQSLVQTYASERVAKDLRARLVAKLATQTYSFAEHVTPAKLLTNLTSDVDGVKLFVSMAIATIIASIFLIAGSSVLLLSINWRLGISVLGIVPFIGITFYLALKKVRELFKKGQEAIDWLNRVINESILEVSSGEPNERAHLDVNSAPTAKIANGRGWGNSTLRHLPSGYATTVPKHIFGLSLITGHLHRTLLWLIAS